MRLINKDALLNNDYISIETIEEAKEINAVVIPDDATNGDAIKALFPNIETFEPNKYEIAIKQNLGWLAFKKDWWNEPYKRIWLNRSI